MHQLLGARECITCVSSARTETAAVGSLFDMRAAQLETMSLLSRLSTRKGFRDRPAAVKVDLGCDPVHSPIRGRDLHVAACDDLRSAQTRNKLFELVQRCRH